MTGNGSTAWAAAALVLLASACGKGDVERAVAAPSSAPRPVDPRLAEVTAALEEGRVDDALAGLAPLQGFQAECLRARAEALRGDAVAALAALERARRLAPDEPELWGTEAEILAALGRPQAAAESLTEGAKRAGMSAVLLRAQGLVELANQGHGPQALAALEHARALDPKLPFLTWPLSQAHLLTGRAMLEKSPGEALAHARACRALAPESLDGRELEAEALTGCLRFEEAIALYE